MAIASTSSAIPDERLPMEGTEPNEQLRLIREYLAEICHGCTISDAAYDHDYREYRFTVNDGEVGTLAIAKEWLVGRPLDEIETELRRRGVTLQALKASGEDYCLVLMQDTLMARLKQN
jgi:hypothetical protein